MDKFKELNFTKILTGNRDLVQFLCDGYIQTDDGGFFPVHRVLMSLKSPFFYTAFTAGGLPKGNTICKVAEIKSEIMLKIIEYSFNGKISLNNDTVQDILFAADYLLIEGLSKSCCEYAKANLCLENCVAFYDTFSTLSHLNLDKFCFKFVVVHLEKIATERSSDIVALKFKDLKRVVEDDAVNVSQELKIWDIIIKWLEHDLKNRFVHASELLNCLRLHQYEFLDILNHPIFNELGKYKSEKKKPRRPLPPKTAYILLEVGEPCTFRVTIDEEFDFWADVSRLSFNPDHVVFSRFPFAYLLDSWRCLLFNILTGAVTFETRIRVNWYDFGLASVNGRLYVIGGTAFFPTYTRFRVVDSFDPNTRTWKYVCSSNNTCNGPVTVLKDKIYAFGDRFDQEINRSVISAECYDPLTNTWALLPSINISLKPFAVLSRLCYVYAFVRTKKTIWTRRYNSTNDAAGWKKCFRGLKDCFIIPKATVLRGSIIVYEGSDESTSPQSFKWNTKTRQWESLDGFYRDLRNYHIGLISRNDCKRWLRYRFEYNWKRIPGTF